MTDESDADLTSCSPAVRTVGYMTDAEGADVIAQRIAQAQQQERIEQNDRLRREFDRTDRIADVLSDDSDEQPTDAG